MELRLIFMTKRKRNPTSYGVYDSKGNLIREFFNKSMAEHFANQMRKEVGPGYKIRSNPQELDFIPIKGIRSCLDGSIQVMVEPSISRNPGKKRSLVSKIKKMFSGTIGNPSTPSKSKTTFTVEGKNFRKLSTAKKFAKALAKRENRETFVVIDRGTGSEGMDWEYFLPGK